MTEEIPNTKGAWQLIALMTIMTLIACVQSYRWEPQIDNESHNNLIQEIRKQQIERATPKNVRVTAKNSVVLGYIYDIFPQNQWEEAVNIAHCESSMRSTAHGDKHLTFIHEEYGEEIGDSIGVFQIRTGGKERNGHVWNRARANGMSAEAFREWMFDPRENVKYAYEIYKRVGWSAWTCSGAH